jgi:hypothetical protein
MPATEKMRPVPSAEARKIPDFINILSVLKCAATQALVASEVKIEVAGL